MRLEDKGGQGGLEELARPGVVAGQELAGQGLGVVRFELLKLNWD